MKRAARKKNGAFDMRLRRVVERAVGKALLLAQRRADDATNRLTNLHAHDVPDHRTHPVADFLAYSLTVARAHGDHSIVGN